MISVGSLSRNSSEAVRYVAGLGERFGGAVPGATEAEKVETGLESEKAERRLSLTYI